jgi:hypothetical protein
MMFLTLTDCRCEGHGTLLPAGICFWRPEGIIDKSLVPT